ncbi:hypothetical protein ACFL4A_04925, partial [bacterium]
MNKQITKPILAFLSCAFILQSVIFPQNNLLKIKQNNCLAVDTCINDIQKSPLSDHSYILEFNKKTKVYIDKKGNLYAFDKDKNDVWQIRYEKSDQPIDKELFQKIKTYILGEIKTWKQTKITGLKGMLLRTAAELLLEPSSIAYFLDNGRHINIFNEQKQKQKHASVYHRSAKNPAIKGKGTGKGVAGEVVKNPNNMGNTGQGNEAHLGLYPNIVTHKLNSRVNNTTHLKVESPTIEGKEQVKKIVGGKRQPLETNFVEETGDGLLYDLGLEYRLKLCQKVKEKFDEDSVGMQSKYIAVNVANDYPNVMVHIDLKQILTDYSFKVLKYKGSNILKASSGTKKSFTVFLMSYYTGIVNYMAQKKDFKITMTERSSFGFFSPTIAETCESFRINFGIVHPDYIDVHVEALRYLNDSL